MSTDLSGSQRAALPEPVPPAVEVAQLADAIEVAKVTAACTGCSKHWTLTGRVLRLAIDTHEGRIGHIVDIPETVKEAM